MDNKAPRYVIYFMKATDSKNCSYVKIGVSGNVNTRLKTIQASCPLMIEIIKVMEAPPNDVYAIERQLHNKLSAYRIHGEWFMLTDYVLCAINGFFIDMPIHNEPTKLNREYKTVQEWVDDHCELLIKGRKNE